MNTKVIWKMVLRKKYHIDQLLYYEQTTDVYAAIAREKQIKGWTREKKIALIRHMNPTWKDLYLELLQG